MTHLTHTTNKQLTDLLKVVLPEYEIKSDQKSYSGLWQCPDCKIIDKFERFKFTIFKQECLNCGHESTSHNFEPVGTLPLITLHTLIDLLSGDKPKILNQRNPWYTSKSEIQVFPDIRVDGQEMTLATLLGIIGIDPPPKTTAQSFLREDIESGRVLTDFEGVCLELIKIIKTEYNL